MIMDKSILKLLSESHTYRRGARVRKPKKGGGGKVGGGSVAHREFTGEQHKKRREEAARHRERKEELNAQELKKEREDSSTFYGDVIKLIVEKYNLINEGRIKAANKAKRKEFETKQGRKIDSMRVDSNPKKSIQRGLAAARHSKGTKTERTKKGVEALQRGRYRDAQKEDS